MSSEVAALPPDAVLVHVGMHKTGTTAMQSLLARQRPELRRLGVHYPGSRDAHHGAARALLRRPAGWRSAGGKPPPSPQVWDKFAAEVRGTHSRVVVSSEFLSRAGPADAQRAVDDLGGERVHILLGVRNFAPIAVSSWQQSLKAGGTLKLEQWLQRHFRRRAAATPPRTFWDRQDPATALSHWTDAAGADHVVVVVIDEGDRTLLPRTFERLLALPEGILAGQQPAMTNRGMTRTEAELVRRTNLALGPRLSWPQYAGLIRYGMVRRLVEARPVSAEPRPGLPEWALRQAAQEGTRVADQIHRSGVRVVGDLHNLTDESTHDVRLAAQPASVDSVPLEAAVDAVVGTATGAARVLDQTPTAGLVSALAARARAAAARRLRALRERWLAGRPPAGRVAARSLRRSAR